MMTEIVYPFQIAAFTSAFDFYWESDFMFLGESHSMWELVCVLDGEVEVSEDENIYVLRAGDFICHAAMEFHCIRSVGGTSPHVLVMSFMPVGTLPRRLCDGVFHLNADEIGEYAAVFARIRRVWHADAADEYSAAEAACALASFLIRLSHNAPSANRLSQTRRAMEYRRVIQSMQMAVCENLSLQDIAARNAVSVSTIKQLFRAYAGISPGAYYDSLRGNEAVRLLKEGVEIQTIAERLNFSSPHYFSRFFKKHFGLPPAQYRRQT